MTLKPIPEIENTQLVISKDIAGYFDNDGYLVVSGTMYRADLWKDSQVRSVILPAFKPVVGAYFSENIGKFNWKDILAFIEAIKRKEVNQYTGRLSYRFGRHWKDETGLYIMAKDIVESSGTVGWNDLVKKINEANPAVNESDPVFVTDPELKVVIYKSGKVVWLETGKSYFNAANGAPRNYNLTQKIVTFINGFELNLKEMVRTNPGGQQTQINNEPGSQIVQKVLTDSKTQLLLLGSLLILLFIKAKRNKRL